MSLPCALARPLVVASVLDERPLPGLARRHTDRCLRCRALEARTRSTSRTMRELSRRREGVPVSLFGMVMSSLEEDPPFRRRRILPWPPLAAGVAVAAVMLLWRRRAAVPIGR